MSAEYRIIIIWWISLLPREWIRVIGPRWVSSKLDSLSGPLCWFSPATLLKWIRVHRFRGVSCRIGVGQKLSTHFFSKKNWWINERAEVFTRESGPDCRFCCACGALGGRAAWLGGRRVALDAASRRSWCCRRLQPRHHCRSPPKSAPGADPTVLLASVAAAAAAAAAAAVAAAAAAAVAVAVAVPAAAAAAVPAAVVGGGAAPFAVDADFAAVVVAAAAAAAAAAAVGGRGLGGRAWRWPTSTWGTFLARRTICEGSCRGRGGGSASPAPSLSSPRNKWSTHRCAPPAASE